MRILKTLSIATLTMAMAASNVQAYPTFDAVADDANAAGANITKSLWNTTMLTNDALWTVGAGSEVKFKSETSGYDNKMGYAGADGSSPVLVLDEGVAPGAWISIAAAPDPFTFYLDTNNVNGDKWFSKDSLNTDAGDHLMVFQRLSGENKFLLFWDDQAGGGDVDYNDFVARVNYVDVPAPATLGILGLGLLALRLTKKRRG